MPPYNVVFMEGDPASDTPAPPGRHAGADAQQQWISPQLGNWAFPGLLTHYLVLAFPLEERVMLLLTILCVSIAIALATAISVDTMYHAVAEGRWTAAVPGALFMVTCIALLA